MDKQPKKRQVFDFVLQIIRFFRNVGRYVDSDTTYHPRQFQSPSAITFVNASVFECLTTTYLD